MSDTPIVDKAEEEYAMFTRCGANGIDSDPPDGWTVARRLEMQLAQAVKERDDMAVRLADAVSAGVRVTIDRDEARAEMRRYLPVLDRIEGAPLLWELATQGTGIATLNGYRRAALGDAPRVRPSGGAS